MVEEKRRRMVIRESYTKISAVSSFLNVRNGTAFQSLEVYLSQNKTKDVSSVGSW